MFTLKSKKLVFIILALLLLAIFVYFKINQGKKLKPQLDIKKAQTFEIRKGGLQKNLILSGKIDAEDFAVLRFQSSGRLSWIGAKEGDRVNKWQAVASLDKESLKKSLEKEMNDYLTSRWNFEDTQDEYKDTRDRFLLTPELQRILDRQQFTLNNSVLDVEIADLAVKYATLVSPIEGIVTNIENYVAGVNVTPTNFSATIINPSSIYFKSEVDEEDVKHLTEGQKATIALDSFPQSEINSVIDNISFTPIEGQTSTAYKIKFSLPVDNPQLRYRIGMNGDAKIILEEKNDVLAIPVEAYFEDEGKKFVYLKDTKTNKITSQEIKTGIESDEEVEIIEGLLEGQIIIY